MDISLADGGMERNMADMRGFSRLIIASLTLFASGCSVLSSTRPMFSPADAARPAPLVQGTWVAIDEDCPRSALEARPLPEGCEPFDVRPESDSVWIASGDERNKDGEIAHSEMRLIIAPATEHVAPDTFAPLYVVQVQNDSPEGKWLYFAFAPVGEMPAHELILLAGIDCDAALREGSIRGIRAETHGRLNQASCVASTPAAVREAARRAMIQILPHVDQIRLVRLDH